MDLAFSPEEQAFRAEVDAFVAERLPLHIREAMRLGRGLDKSDHGRWQRILNDRGWAAPHWPEEHGGAGWDATRRYLFSEALAAGDAPELPPFGLNMVGPVIYTFGDEAQKKRFLPPILSGDDFWCQGYSEPGAGSDLASLGTRAVVDGDHYVVNGTKTWTSLAHWADWMFCLVRTATEGKPQEGISFLLIDMTTPGIEVKPIFTIDGGHHVNMTYLTDVRVPIANRVGEEESGLDLCQVPAGDGGDDHRRSRPLETAPAPSSRHGPRRKRGHRPVDRGYRLPSADRRGRGRPAGRWNTPTSATWRKRRRGAMSARAPRC